MFRSVILSLSSFVFIFFMISGFVFIWFQLDKANSQIQLMEASWRDSVNTAMIAMKYRQTLDERFIEDEKTIIQFDSFCFNEPLPERVKQLLTVNQ